MTWTKAFFFFLPSLKGQEWATTKKRWDRQTSWWVSNTVRLLSGCVEWVLLVSNHSALMAVEVIAFGQTWSLLLSQGIMSQIIFKLDQIVLFSSNSLYIWHLNWFYLGIKVLSCIRTVPLNRLGTLRFIIFL